MGSLDPTLGLNFIWIIVFISAAFIIIRGVLHAIDIISKTAGKIGELMDKYTWVHKKEEQRVHYWEFINSPTGILFPGVVLFPILFIIEKVYEAPTFFRNYPVAFKYFTMTWIFLGIGCIIYLLGVIIYYAILCPHFIWHVVALTTIPKAEIDIVKHNELFTAFRNQFLSLAKWGFLGIPFLLLIYFPMVTGLYPSIVLEEMFVWIIMLGIIYILIQIIVPRFLNCVMVPIEWRESEQMPTDYLQYPKDR